MKLFSLFTLLLLIIPINLFALPRYEPCYWKKLYDDNPNWDPEWPVSLVMGRTFRKKDTCQPMISQISWKQKYYIDELHNHHLNYKHTLSGEIWFRDDTQFLAMIGNPMQYEGKDYLYGAQGHGITCLDLECRNVVQFPSVQMKELFGTWNTNWSFARPTVEIQGEIVPEAFWAQSNLYEYHSGEHYLKPGPIKIDNLALAEQLSINYLDVVAAMAQKRPYSFTVEYDGNEEVDDTSHNSGTVAFNLYFGCPTNLHFISPSEGEKVIFNSDSEGVVEFEAEVAFENYPESFLNDVEWSIPEKSGSEPIYVPNTRKGKKIKLGYKKLPQFNEDFGETTIEAYINLGSQCGEFRTSRKVNLFYPRQGTNSPAGPSEPNWYYYWQQSSAGRGTKADQDITYKGTSGLCGTELSFRGYFPYKDVNQCGQNHIVGEDYIAICDFAKPQVDFKLLTATTDEELDGIDAFAVSVAHELLHLKHWKDWWNPIGGWPYTGKRTIGNGGACISLQNIDVDLDYVPDSLEPGLGLKPNDRFTYRQQYGTGEMWDEHYLTYKGAEDGWTPGQADKEDWSKPGHQWK